MAVSPFYNSNTLLKQKQLKRCVQTGTQSLAPQAHMAALVLQTVAVEERR